MWDIKCKDTIILFHANWCGHCQVLMPIWKELKTKINTEEYNIIEIESQNPFTNKIKILKGYPSIYYISIEKKETIEYNDKRNLKSLLNFLKNNKN